MNEVGMFLKPRRGAWKPEDHEVFGVFNEGLTKNLDVSFVVPGWARVHCEVCAPKFSNWWNLMLDA